MAIRFPVETLKAIDSALEKDQGARFRQLLQTVIPHIGDAYRGQEESFRSHMGASLIGGECARAIWYGWRWVTKPKFSGRILRLFNRGHLEEARFIALLLMIDVQVYQQDAEGKQYRISHAEGHFGGSGDGVGINIPDFQVGQPALLEFKTHGEKSFFELAGKNWKDYVEFLKNPKTKFAKFEGKGLREAKFEHYVQMQTYMRKMGLALGLYVAVNKNTDEIYMEIVVLDEATADQFLDRGLKLVLMPDPPDKMNESPGFWKCRFCDHRPVCHLGAEAEVNCRTCRYSQPVKDAQWICTKYDQIISKELQLTGCQHYEKHPKI